MSVRARTMIACAAAITPLTSLEMSSSSSPMSLPNWFSARLYSPVTHDGRPAM